MALEVEFNENGNSTTLQISKIEPVGGDDAIEKRTDIVTMTLPRDFAELLLEELASLSVTIIRGSTVSKPPILDGDVRVKPKKPK